MEITNKESINIIGNKKEKPILEKTNNESINIIGNKKEKPIEKPLEITNNESMRILGNKLEKYIEIINNESINIIGNKKEKSSEIFKNESLYILGNKIKKPSEISEICNNESINLIGAETKPSIKEICRIEPINISGDKKEKIVVKKICQNEKITIINEINKAKQNIFDFNKINKDKVIEMVLCNNNKIDKKELIKENQINLNIEIKGLEQPKKKYYKDCLINDKNNSINITEPNRFNLNLISQKNDINIHIINEKPIVQDEKGKKTSNISKENIVQFIIENKCTSKQSKSAESSNKNEYINICENERFSLINEGKKNSNNVDLIVVKGDEILLIEKNRNLHNNNNRKKDIEFIIVKKNNIFIERTQKIQCDKITEITEELNRIEPNNHYELIFEGKININGDITKINNIENNNIIDNNKQ
jgi:hypothetical protein